MKWKQERNIVSENVFGSKAEDIAKQAIEAVNPLYTNQFVNVVRFLRTQPGLAKTIQGKTAPRIGTDGYIERLAIDFVAGRAVRGPKPPATVPDEMVSKILVEYFDINEKKIESIKSEHLLAMASEGIVGNVLEHYIASVVESSGWTWCSGSMVLAVDFIKSPSKSNDVWRMLQIKNRSNSENSSSSKIRKGTSIEKWYRVHAGTGETKWGEFPDFIVKSKLTEPGFGVFLSRYLGDAKKTD
jgi:hypothetical protein